MQLSGKASACLLSVCDFVFPPQILVTLARARNKIEIRLWEIWLFKFCINEAESKPPRDSGMVRPPTSTRLGRDTHGLTYLERRGRRRAAGRAGV